MCDVAMNMFIVSVFSKLLHNLHLFILLLMEAEL